MTSQPTHNRWGLRPVAPFTFGVMAIIFAVLAALSGGAVGIATSSVKMGVLAAVVGVITCAFIFGIALAILSLRDRYLSAAQVGIGWLAPAGFMFLAFLVGAALATSDVEPAGYFFACILVTWMLAAAAGLAVAFRVGTIEHQPTAEEAGAQIVKIIAALFRAFAAVFVTVCVAAGIGCMLFADLDGLLALAANSGGGWFWASVAGGMLCGLIYGATQFCASLHNATTHSS